MSHILETARLQLRPFTLADTGFILELLNSDTWIRFIGDRNVRNQQQAEAYLTGGPMKSYAEHGFGLSLVALKEGNKPVGMCGLLKRPQLDDPDIGFAFLPQYTGQGYAFEIAAKTLENGFSQFGLEKIVAITDPENASSVRLLEKLGMRFEKRIPAPNGAKELLMYGAVHA